MEISVTIRDKRQIPRGNVTHERALLPGVFWSHFREGIHQTAIYDQE